MRKTLLYFVLLCIQFACFSPQEKKKNCFHINVELDPQTLDPRCARSLAERNLMFMIFEGLTREGKGNTVDLSLAESIIESDDGLKYTIFLRKALWSNGDPITAMDFLQAWQMALSPGFISENCYTLFCIESAKEIKEGKKPASDLGVHVLGERTLEICLQHPVPYFLQLLSLPIFFPVHEKSDFVTNSVICNGPFLCKEWKHQDHIELTKNPTYFAADLVHLSSIFLSMVSPETEVQMFEKGELDWAGSPISTISLDQMQEYKKNHLLHDAPFLGTRFFRLNIEDPFLNNISIRKALALSIHREDIIEHVLQGYQKVALQFLPTSSLSYLSDGNEEEARELFHKGLAEMGLTKEDLPTLTILCVGNQQNRLLAQAVQQDWKKVLGIDVALQVREVKVYYDLVDRKEYQIALGSWFADYNDEESFLEIFQDTLSANNHTGWGHEEYTRLLEKAKRLRGEERESELLHCESILMRELPIIPLYHYRAHYVKNPHFQGENVTPLGNIQLHNAYFTEGEKW